MDLTSFILHLKTVIGEGFTLPPHIFEEYTYNGMLDLKYLQVVTDSRTTQAKFNALVNLELGSIKFTRKPVAEDELMTREEFLEHYKFGEAPNVRGWIGTMYRVTNKILLREHLYDYISCN